MKKLQTKIVEIQRIFNLCRVASEDLVFEKISTMTSASSMTADYLICNVFYVTSVHKATKESDYVTFYASLWTVNCVRLCFAFFASF